MPPALDPLPASGIYAGGEHLFPVRVFYEDTDLSGVVYHANYLRYMERARSDMLRVSGIDQRAAFEAGVGHYAVAQVDLRYRAPARLDDALLVRSRVREVGAARCVIDQAVWRDDTLLAQGQVTVAFVDPSGRPRRQPAAWIETFNQLVVHPS
jgi:acyl-CoA thioester hydrolase